MSYSDKKAYYEYTIIGVVMLMAVMMLGREEFRSRFSATPLPRNSSSDHLRIQQHNPTVSFAHLLSGLP